MNKTQASYLLVAVFSFLAVITMLFFAITASKNTIAFAAIAVFFALIGTFWVYRFAKVRRRTL